MTANNVAQLVIEALRRCEIDTLFCLPGVQNDDFFDQLVDARDIRPVVTRHEQGAAYMAMGAAQVTGRPSAFCVVPGPGMLNATGGLTSAYWGYARVLAVIGGIASTLQGRDVGTLHDLNNPTAVLEQVTKEAIRVADPADASTMVQRAVDAVHGGVPRPVSIEVPVDVWGREADGRVSPPTVAAPQPDPDKVAEAASLLARARRPMIVVGSGAYDAGAEVLELAERFGAVVTTRRQGHGVVPTAHPRFVPLTVAHGMWADADVVLGVGSRMEWPLNSWGLDDQLTIIQVNVDAEELDRHDIGATGLHADAALGCRALLDALDADHGDRSASAGIDQAELAARREAFDQATAHLVPQRAFTAAIRDVMPEDGALVEDVTQIGFASHLFYDHRRPRSFLTSGAAGTLGAGTAVAIGAAAVHSGPVVGIVGDGGFLFTATELATAVQHNIPCTILLFNDGAFGNVKRIQKERFGADRTIASTLRNPDFRLLADAFGVRYWRADSPGDLRPALGAAIDHDGPALVEVQVEEMPNPWPFFRPPATRGPGAVG